MRRNLNAVEQSKAPARHRTHIYLIAILKISSAPHALHFMQFLQLHPRNHVPYPLPSCTSSTVAAAR